MRVGHMKMVNHQLHRLSVWLGKAGQNVPDGLLHGLSHLLPEMDGGFIGCWIWVVASCPRVLEECWGRIPSALPVAECGSRLPSPDGLTGEEDLQGQLT